MLNLSGEQCAMEFEGLDVGAYRPLCALLDAPLGDVADVALAQSTTMSSSSNSEPNYH
jgi:hypothetical protein